ncbi:MAG: DUF1887 family protein [Dysgonamonadaceae bacterium]|jgi:uncharacterized protein YunC (DUF1805 family)|nr:DUF1887 family protein [Dysgonamonadaceae bacterium]
MKSYLLTWFGMTDFRAAKNCRAAKEEGDKSKGIQDGPIFAALKEHPYTDVLIMCPVIENDGEQNTVEGHKILLDSLKERMEKYMVDHKDRESVTIKGIPCTLANINDYEHMKSSVVEALRRYDSVTDPKLLSVYLSPGTTLMAYAWSEALRQYPHIDAKILVSPREDAETRVVDTRGTALKGDGNFIDDYEYDAIFHLFSENKIPNLLALKQFSKCKKHIFLTDEKMPASSMRVLVKDYAKEFASIENIDPNNPRSVFKTVSRHLDKYKEKYKGNLGFNVTGGTKPMMAGALDVCRAYGIVPFYYGRKLIDFTNGDKKVAACLDNVNEIVKLNMDRELTFEDATETEGSFNIAKKIVENRGLIERHYKYLNESAQNRNPLEICEKNIEIRWAENEPAYLRLRDKEIINGKFSDFPRFISGGWLELYVYSQLMPLKDDGLIKDIRLNYTVKYENNKYNEADVLFTDGQKLYFVECKAGEVKLDAIDKVKNTAAALGGVKAVPIIVAATVFEPTKIPEVRQRKMKNLGIELIKGDDIDIPRLTEKFRNIIGV